MFWNSLFWQLWQRWQHLFFGQAPTSPSWWQKDTSKHFAAQSCLDKFLTYKQICDSWKGQLVRKYINKEWQNWRWRYIIITSLSRRMNKCFWEKETVGVGQNLKPSLFGKIKSLNRVKRAFFKRGILYLFHNSITQLKSRDQDLNPSPHTQKYRIVLKKTMSEF